MSVSHACTYLQLYSFIVFALKNGNKRTQFGPPSASPPEVARCRVKATFPTFLKKSSLSAGNLIKVEWHPLVIRHTMRPLCPKELLTCTRKIRFSFVSLYKNSSNMATKTHFSTYITSLTQNPDFGNISTRLFTK